jgi:transcriptional regulator with XRE-family HTH domain
MAANKYRERMNTNANDRGRDFANLIRDARNALGLTQEDVIIASGVSKSTIIRWEGGRAERPDPDQVRALCRVLRIDPKRAAVALGYLHPDDLGDPVVPGRKLDPSILEVIEILEDPRVPSDEKLGWVRYLRYIKSQARTNGDRNAS